MLPGFGWSAIFSPGRPPKLAGLFNDMLKGTWKVRRRARTGSNGHRHAKTSARRDRGDFPDRHAARQNSGYCRSNRNEAELMQYRRPLRPLVHGDLVLDWRQALPQPRLVKLLHVELPPPERFKVSDPSDCESLPSTALSSSPEIRSAAADFIHESRLGVGTWRPNENQASAPKRRNGRRSRPA